MTIPSFSDSQGLSQHTRLAALATAQAWNVPGQHIVLPPEGEGFDVGDGVLYVHRGQVSEHYGDTSIDVLDTVPYDTPGVLVVGYLYRDAGNYKQHGSVAVQGPFSRRDLGILLAALTAGDDGCFIPSQLGWRDLQPDGGDSDQDHVWHETTDITWRPTGQVDTTWDALRPLCLARLAKGYDLMEAMARLESSW